MHCSPLALRGIFTTLPGVYALVTTARQRAAREGLMSDPEKVCPRCAERVKAAANVCRFCNHEFPPAAAAPATPGLAHRLGRLAGRVWGSKVGRWAVIGLGCVSLVGLLLPKRDGPSSQARSITTVNAQATAPLPATLTQPAPVAKAEDVEKARTLAKVTMESIQGRLDENRTHLKKYYADDRRVTQSGSDQVQLATVLVQFEGSKDKGDKKLAVQAKALQAQVAQQTRDMYASTLEEIFIKNGIDARVRTSGSVKDRLNVTYALMSQPLVYRFQNEMHLDEQARKMGFKKLVLSNGFESELGKAWTFDL
jgi:hypothetical protein